MVLSTTFNQQVYRWYLDGTESGSTAAAAQNTAYTVTVNVQGNGTVLLRIAIANTGVTDGAATDDYQLQYDKNGAASWNDVTTSSSNIKAFNSSNLTDGNATTNRLTGATGTFVAGEICEDGLVDDLTVLQSFYTELLYTLEPVAADLVTGDYLTFRVLRAGGVLETYTVTPRLDISKTVIRNANTIVEVLADSPAAALRNANTIVEVLADSPAAALRNANTIVEVLADSPAAKIRLADIYVEVLCSVDVITRPTRRAGTGLSAY